MKKIITKIAGAILLVTITFFGINLSYQKKSISGELANVTIVSLGIQAQAYCNEAGFGQINNGLCTGMSNDPTARCLPPADIFAKGECMR